MSIKVSIVEDTKDIREGLASLINGSEGFSCISTYSNGEDALENLINDSPDVILMDIGLPKMSGTECIKRLKQKNQNLLIVILSVYEDDEHIFNSLLAGASGYLIKKTPPAKLLESITDVYNGGSPMSSRIARKVVSAFQATNKSSNQTENLSQRELEILSYLAKGFRYKEIAEKLFISVETVRTHLRNIYEKLHVRSRTEAVLKYLNK